MPSGSPLPPLPLAGPLWGMSSYNYEEPDPGENHTLSMKTTNLNYLKSIMKNGIFLKTFLLQFYKVSFELLWF